MNIVNDARKLALSKKSPPKVLFEISENKALDLCGEFSEANKVVVHVGVCLMDIMLEEALVANKVSEHVQMCVIAAREFLANYDIPQEDKDKIINCVEAHHKNVEFKCIEAEICANADCYRFIHPRGFFYYLILLGGERSQEFSKVLDQAEYKIDEKRKILSLQQCKDELAEYYDSLKKFIDDARNFKTEKTNSSY